MRKVTNYTCKNCDETYGGPGDLGRHYNANPSHRPSYKPKHTQLKHTFVGKAKIVAKTNGHAPELRAESQAFGQLTALKEQFAGEIKSEEQTIERLKIEMTEHVLKLDQLRATQNVLLSAEQAKDRDLANTAPSGFALPA
jgi:hypothetical protein